MSKLNISRMMSTVSKSWYLCQRPAKQPCLAYVRLNIHATVSESRRLKVSAEDIGGKLRDVDSKARLLLSSLRVTEEKQGLQIEFWCQSGTKCFKPTKKPFKNCVEVTIFEFTKVVLQLIKGEVAKTDINYMTDLSPCSICTRRLPTQQHTLEADFPNIVFSYHGEFVVDYEVYKRQKCLQYKETWIKVGELSERRQMM